MLDLMDATHTEVVIDPWMHREFWAQIDAMLPKIGINDTFFHLVQGGELSNGSVTTLDWAEANGDYEDDEWEGDNYRQMMEGHRPDFVNPHVVLKVLKDKGLITFPETGQVTYKIWW